MNQTYMKEKPILPLLLSMALPMVISMMVNSLYNIVDSYFVARISEEAMTALSLVYPIQNFITSVGVGFGIGINAAIAFFLGAQDQKKADAAATQGLFLSVIHGIVLTVVTIAVMPLFLQIFTKDVTVIQMGNAYSRIAFGFSIVISLEITWEKIFQAVGRMRVSMICMMSGCIFNIVLDPLLIFGIGPAVIDQHPLNGHFLFFQLFHLINDGIHIYALTERIPGTPAQFSEDFRKFLLSAKL